MSSSLDPAAQLRSLVSRAGQRLRPGSAQPDGGHGPRWLVVTVEATSDEIAPNGQLPAPLAAYADQLEWQVRPAPGDRGTELAVRPVLGGDADGGANPPPADEVRAQLREALRQAKQLIEVGEVLVAGPRPEGYRPRTIAGLLVDRAEQKSAQGGVL